MIWSLAVAGSIADQVRLDGTIFSPATTGGSSLGSNTRRWASADFSDGAFFRFNGAYTLTHSTGILTANGQVIAVGTTTNDNAASGIVGEFIRSRNADTVFYTSATVTMTIAAPCVVTWTSHGFAVGAVTTAVVFTTTGALPTGLTAGTTYYLKAIDANTFNVATSADNALAGTFITTTGSQSGDHTGNNRVTQIVGTQNIAAISLGAGDWDVCASVGFIPSGTTTVKYLVGELTKVSATRSDITGQINSQVYQSGFTPVNDFLPAFPIGPARFSLASTTTIYVVTTSDFAASTLLSFGYVQARRMR